jgi:hypothetical protein
MKNGISLSPKQHDVIKSFIAASKTKENLKQKQLTLQEKHIMHEAIKIWDFYFRALGSLVVLSFPQLLSFSSVLSKPLAETVTGAGTAGCPTVEHL